MAPCGIEGFGRVPGSVTEPELRRFLDRLARAPEIWLSGSGLQVGDDGTVEIDAGEVDTGVLKIANGGTNSGTALANNKIMVSSGGKIVEGTSSATPSFTTVTTTQSTGTAPFVVASTTVVTNLNADLLDGQHASTFATVASPVLTTPQINDTSADHQYVFAVSELAADRTVTLPQLSGNDTFVFEAHAATLTNKTIALGSNTVSGTKAQFDTAVTDGTIAFHGGAHHDGFSDFVANEHIDHTSVTLTAGEGLSGGGTIAANRTFAVDFSDLSTADTAIGGTDLISIHDGAQKKITWSNAQSSITAVGTIATGVWNGTDVAVADGGTGASSASAARTNLGVAIGSDVQAYDATLNALASYNTNGLLTQTGADTFTGREITGTSNEIEVSNGTGVSGNPQVGLPDDVTIAGNLTVNGTVTTIDTTNLVVEDPLIKLATNNNAADSVDIGFYGLYDTSGSQDLYAGLFRDANDSGKWKLFKDSQTEPTTTVNTSATGYAVATLVANVEGTVTGTVSDISNHAITGLSDVGAKTGSGTTVVFNTSPTIVTPTIASFANAGHDHTDAAGGGTLSTSAIGSGTFADARISQSSVTQHAAAIDHDALTNFVANEHINHTSVTLTAGDGLSGGGTIAANRTFNVDINGTTDLASPATGDELLISDADDSNAIKKADVASVVNLADHDALTNFVANEHINHTAVTLTAGDGLSGGGTIAANRTFNVDINGATDLAGPATGDELLLSDADDSNSIKKADVASVVNLADHDALTNFVANEHVNHTSVTLTAGDGLSGGGNISANRTFDVDINGTTDLGSPATADELLISDTDDSNAIKKADVASVVNLADHDALTNFVANEHVDHSSVSITAGDGLSGGGNLTATRTVNVNINATTDLGSPATGDELLISDADNGNAIRKADVASVVNLADHDALTNFVGNEHVNHTSVSITAGAGLTGGGDISSTRTIDVDINGTTDLASPAVGDELLISDADDSNAIRKADVASVVNLADHDALTNFVANEHIDWTSTSSNLSTTGTATTGLLTVQVTTDNASVQQAVFKGGNRSTPADGDESYASFQLDDSTGNQAEFARLTWEANDVTNTSKDGEMRLSVMKDNTLTTAIIFDETGFRTFDTALVNANYAIGGSEAKIHTRQELSVRGEYTDTSGTQGALAVAANDNAASESSCNTRAIIGQAGSDIDSTHNLTGRVDGLFFQTQHRGSGTLDDAACILVGNGNNTKSGTTTNQVGLYIDRQEKAHVTNGYGIYQWYSGDTNYLEGNLGLGQTSPDTKLHVDGVVTLEEETTTPADPDDGAECRIYMKDDKLIIQYNHGGTVRYKYLALTGTGVDWTHTTSPP